MILKKEKEKEKSVALVPRSRPQGCAGRHAPGLVIGGRSLTDAVECCRAALQSLFHTALAGTLYFEGKVLSAFARDPAARRAHSGLAVMTGQLAQHYGVVDERGARCDGGGGEVIEVSMIRTA
jgi:hypothetical protein